MSETRAKHQRGRRRRAQWNTAARVLAA